MGRPADASLGTLLLHLDTAASHQLHARLGQTEREGRCIRRAMLLTMVLLLVSLGGLACGTILLPDAFQNSPKLLLHSLLVLGLGTVIFQAVLLAHAIGNRVVRARLRESCLHLFVTHWPGFILCVASPGADPLSETVPPVAEIQPLTTAPFPPVPALSGNGATETAPFASARIPVAGGV